MSGLGRLCVASGVSRDVGRGDERVTEPGREDEQHATADICNQIWSAGDDRQKAKEDQYYRRHPGLLSKSIIGWLSTACNMYVVARADAIGPRQVGQTGSSSRLLASPLF